MSSQSWVQCHQQRILAEAIEGARRGSLAQQASVGGRSVRTIVAERLAAFVARLDGRPHAAATRSTLTQQPLR